ncbi:MAG: glycosyl hydrolase family 65 protein [Actinomycetota bacterium]
MSWEALGQALRQQVRRGEGLRVPRLWSDPTWAIELDSATTSPRVRETICALANGWIGIRGAAEEESPGSDPRVLAGGVYDDQDPPSLLAGPRWAPLALPVPSPGAGRWLVDLRTGILTRSEGAGSGMVRTSRFVSLARPGCVALRVEAPEPVAAGAPLLTSEDGRPGPRGSILFSQSSRGAITAAGEDRTGHHDGVHTLERITAYVAARDGPRTDEALAQLDELRAVGYERLLAEHRQAWARRWADAAVTIAGDDQSEKALRFALFHLLSAAPSRGEAAVGARGLTGPAYRGHVFWDSDVFVLPALSAICPPAARAMLEYRIRRLPAARRAARQEGAAGARFPWESADDGSDVTPRRWKGPDGRDVAIRTGPEEVHIVADVAWAACHYANWTGDVGFLAGPGRDLILDTARYWKSRIVTDPSGKGHLLGVMGPDEYHPGVDDNAFTNVMARANLRWASSVGRRHGGAGESEISEWELLAGGLVDGYDPADGVYEQFTGYSRRVPLRVEQLASPPVAADVLLGPEAVSRTQLIKQADVLMLHHMVPDQVAAGSLEPNLDHYLPRTAHGSSLSPPIHASLLARAGRRSAALEWFRLTGRIDLEDLTRTTAGGVHLAAMGGLWQAFTFGFLGLAVRDGWIRLDPRLPPGWSSVTQNLLALGARLRLQVAPGRVEVRSDRPVTIECGGAISGGTTIRFRAGPSGWREDT